MPLINFKVELKIKWTKYCVLHAAGTDNVNGNINGNSIVFTINDTKSYVPVVTLSARDNKKLSKLLSKGFERSVYWNEYKTKVRLKLRQMNIGIFSNQIFLESIDYLY